MPKALITLSAAATVVDDFKNLIADKDKVLFIVLGNTDALKNFANKAAADAFDERFAVLVTVPEQLYPTLTNLPKDGVILPAVYDPTAVTAICLATDSTVCVVLADTNETNIPMNYLTAEVH